MTKTTKANLLLALFISISAPQGAVAQSPADPDLLPPEVVLPMPGAPSMPRATSTPPPAQTTPGMQGPQGMPGAQVMPGQMPGQGMAAQSGPPIQPFVPSGWPFDGAAPPGQAGGGDVNAYTQGLMNKVMAAQSMGGQPGMAPSQGYAGQPGMAPSQGYPSQPGMTPSQGYPSQPGMTPSQGNPVLQMPGQGGAGEAQIHHDHDGNPQLSADGLAGPSTNGEKDCPMCKRKAAEEAAKAAAAQQKPDPVAIIQTTKGPIKVRLFRKYAPQTVANFLELAQKGFYTNLSWHRVVPGFVIQTGCPKGDGTGGYIPPGDSKVRNIPLELHQLLKHNAAGVVAMARFGNDMNSASSQFYITLGPQPRLDNKYTVFGGVLSGMEAVQRITPQDRILGVEVQGI